MLRILFCLTLAATLLNACTIEKRTFRKGWHVEWKQRHEAVADVSETPNREAAVAEIRRADVPNEETLSEPVAQTASADESTMRVGAAAKANNVTDEAEEAAHFSPVEERIVATEESFPDQGLSLDPSTDAPTAGQGLWWVVALLVGIALAATIWLAVGTAGNAGLLVALFVALFASVVGAIVISIRLKKAHPKEPEEDIQFDELTENEVQRKKKLKGLIAALVLVVVGVTIILVGSK